MALMKKCQLCCVVLLFVETEVADGNSDATAAERNVVDGPSATVVVDDPPGVADVSQLPVDVAE